jgi:hypothetical protein
LAQPIKQNQVLCATLCVLCSMSGCSWLFVQPLPPPPLRTEPLNCTTSRAAPVLDTLFTATNVASAIYVGSQDNVANKGTAVTFGLAVAALWLSSAVYGYSKTSECEDAMAEDQPPPRRRYYAPPPRYQSPPPYSAPPPSPYAPPAGYPPPPPPGAAAPAPAPPAAAPPPTPTVPQSQDQESP